ncbi:MAG: hypothetical protein ACE5FG_13095 [Myxococcota bacterium]
MPRALLAALVLSCACAMPQAPLTLDRVRGVYRSHFGGIPDSTGICAVLSNRSERPIAWVRLRLRSYGVSPSKRWRWTSSWLYDGAIPPGQSVALLFEDPPHAQQIEIRIDRFGRGGGRPHPARPLRAVASCSEPNLRSVLADAAEGREATQVQLVPIVRRGAALDAR